MEKGTEVSAKKKECTFQIQESDKSIVITVYRPIDCNFFCLFIILIGKISMKSGRN